MFSGENGDLTVYRQYLPKGFEKAIKNMKSVSHEKTQSGLLNTHAEIDGNNIMMEFFPVHTR